MSRRFWPISGEQVWQARLVAGLTRTQAAALLRVSARTIRNWEGGRVAVPYSAFRLLRIFGGFDLPGWDGWRIYRRVLWSPEGKAFRAEDMHWWGLTVQMARAWAIAHGAATDPPAGLRRPLAMVLAAEREAQRPPAAVKRRSPRSVIRGESKRRGAAILPSRSEVYAKAAKIGTRNRVLHTVPKQERGKWEKA